MSNQTYKLLKNITAVEEIRIEDMANLVKKAFKDHRDYYPLARLFKAGYVDVTLQSLVAGTDFVPFAETQTDLDIAIWAYMNSELEAGEEYLGQRLSGNVDDELIFCTASGMLKLEELSQKRQDRRWALGIGIMAALIAAWATNYFSS